MASIRCVSLALLLVLASPAEALTSWTGSVVWDPLPDSWVPLRLTATGESTWTVKVDTEPASTPVVFRHPGAGVFDHPLYLPQGSRTVSLSFQSSGGETAHMELEVGTRAFPGNIVVTDGLDARTRSALAQMLQPTEPVRVTEAAPTLWPTSALAWQGVALVVVRDPGPVLSPTQAAAVNAWLASGGVFLLVGDPPSGSLRSQLGDPGLGRVARGPDQANPSAWRQASGLDAFGRRSLAGTRFEGGAPPPGGPPWEPLAWVAGIWAAAAVALRFRRRAGLGSLAVLGLLTAAAALAVWAGGGLAWSQGLGVVTREVVLPGGTGRIVWREAATTAKAVSLLEWPATAPWALGVWKASSEADGWQWRSSTPQKVVQQAWLSDVRRPTLYRVRWVGAAQWATPEGAWQAWDNLPPVLARDALWLARLVADWPQRVWRWGSEGSSTWVEPEPLS